MSWVNTRPMVYGSPYGMACGGQEEPFSRLAAILAPRVARNEIQIFSTFLQTPTILVSMDSPGPQQLRINIF